MEKPATKNGAAESSRIETEILGQLDMFQNFVRARVGDPELAQDLVQESLLKAVRKAESVRRSESIIAWFYRILRHSIIDLYRSRDARTRAMERFEQEDITPDAETTRELCACINSLLLGMKPAYAKVLREIDLAGRSVSQFASENKRSTNAVRVKLHRAREQMRKKLEERCRRCAKHGCLDCTCGNENS